MPIDVVNWRVLAQGPRPTLHLPKGSEGFGPSASGEAPGAVKGRRPAYMPESGGLVEVPVYDRYRLAPGHAFEGPAIVEERESTVVIGPRARAHVDDWLNVVVDL